MSGQAGGRGYLIQTLVCLLDAVQSDENWIDVRIEPEDASEKVDIIWNSGSAVKAVQVKSSINQMGISDVRHWCASLERSVPADLYELRLIGPCSESVVSAGTIGRVQVPTPLPLNPVAFIQQAAHRLDGYLEAKGMSKVPGFARELIVGALCAKLATYATSGTPLSRSDLDRLLESWTLSLFPEVISRAVQMQCEVLWDTVYFPLVAPTNDDLVIIVPLTIINDSVRTAVIRDLAIKIEEVGGSTLLYSVGASVDLEEFLRVEMLQTMSSVDVSVEFAVPKGQIIRKNLIFVPTRHAGSPLSWDSDRYNCELYVQFADRDDPTLIKQQTFNPRGSIRRARNGSQGIVTMRANRPLADLLR